MARWHLAVFALALTAAGSASAATVSSLPGKADIRDLTTRVADHYISVRPCRAGSCAITNKWDDAVLMMGVVETWRKFGTAAYRTYATNWAGRNGWSLYSDTSGSDQRNPNWHNRMTAGYTYLRLYQAGTPGASIADVTRNLNAQLALGLTPERQQLVDYVFSGSTKSSFSWKTVDAEFLGLPTWIMMGRETGKTAYYDRARDLQDYQVNVMGLQDPATKLWYRDEATKARRSPSGAKVIWGRGTGWIAGALAIALSETPKSRREYAAYQARFVDLMDAVRTRQRPDGFWNMNVADPKHYPAPETSGTALITFAMAKGINLGILDRDVYAPVAARAWNAMAATAVRNDGRLAFVQSIGSEPVPPSNAGYPDEGTPDTNFGVGALLLAGEEMYDVATRAGKRPVTRYQAESLATSVSRGDRQSDVSSAFASGARANLARLNSNGDYVQFTAPNVESGTYELLVKYRVDPNQAIWRLFTNGQAIGNPVDAYDVEPHYIEASFGTVTYTGAASAKRYRFTVTGKNTASRGRQIHIDSISLAALESEGASALRSLLLPGSGPVGPTVAAAAAPGGAEIAPVPLPGPAALLLSAVGGLGLVRRFRRNRRPPAARG